jgi:tetratricopeptide (TPR) repeat protein
MMAMCSTGPCSTLVSARAQENPAAPAAGPEDPTDESAPSAEALLQRGIELRKSGRDRQALADFERAFSLSGSGRALAQMALAEQALGLWREAHEHLQKALMRSEDQWLAEHRATLETAAIEIASQLGSLEISCNVDGAAVHLDGVLLGETPLPRPVPLVAGANVILVSKPGYFDIARQVNIDLGRLSRLNVVLTPNPSAGTLPSRMSDRAQTEQRPAPTAGSALAAPASGVDVHHPVRDGLFYTALGLSALGVSAGVTGYVLREINVAQYNDDARCSQVLGVRRSDECPGQAAAFQRGEVLAIAGFASAAVFGTTALSLWLTRPTAERRMSFDCVPGIALLACSGHF